MKILIYGNPGTDEFVVFKVPDYLEQYWELYVEPQFNNLYADSFSAWGAAIAAGIAALSSWLKGRTGGDAYREQAGWNNLISRLKSMGITYENSKFVYCNHCDGKTYRVWINNSGAVEFATREATGDNPRFDCKVIKEVLPQIYTYLPSCVTTGKSLTGSLTGTWGNIASGSTAGIPNLVLYLGGGLIAVALLFKLIKMIK